MLKDLKWHNWFKSYGSFDTPGKYAGSPEQNLLSWWTPSTLPASTHLGQDPRKSAKESHTTPA